jgi:hypothetical protein
MQTQDLRHCVSYNPAYFQLKSLEEYKRMRSK